MLVSTKCNNYISENYKNIIIEPLVMYMAVINRIITMMVMNMSNENY